MFRAIQKCLITQRHIRAPWFNTTPLLLNVVVRQQFNHAEEEDEFGRITIPHKMTRELQKMKVKKAVKISQTRRKYKGPVVISCNRKGFNHHQGQTYSQFSPQHLASGGWKNKKSRGEFFTINSVGKNPSIDYGPKKAGPAWETLGLDPIVIDAITNLQHLHPTKIQVQTVPKMLEGKHILCAAETGSGKTNAYLMPILHKLIQHRKFVGKSNIMNQPFAVILTASRELADQLKATCDELATQIDFKSLAVCGGKGTQHIIRNRPQELVDLLIITPGLMSKLVTNKVFDLSRLHHIVFDEADSLLDDSFNSTTMRLLRRMTGQSATLVNPDGSLKVVGTQVVMVGATLPKGLKNILGDIFDEETVETVTTKSIHRLLPHISQKFLRLHSLDRADTLVRAIKSNAERKIPTIVFCNKAESVRYIGHLLDDVGQPNTIFHGDMPQKAREGRFERFQNGEVDILVSTDLGSRGLNTLRAQHVINYDFPNFMSDYIHRCGRVGRVGSTAPPFVLNFIVHKWDVELLWKIEAAARQVTELDNVNANIKRKLESRSQTTMASPNDVGDML